MPTLSRDMIHENFRTSIDWHNVHVSVAKDKKSVTLTDTWSGLGTMLTEAGFEFTPDTKEKHVGPAIIGPQYQTVDVYHVALGDGWEEKLLKLGQIYTRYK